jgi:hypothetical protein
MGMLGGPQPWPVDQKALEKLGIVIRHHLLGLGIEGRSLNHAEGDAGKQMLISRE